MEEEGKGKALPLKLYLGVQKEEGRNGGKKKEEKINSTLTLVSRRIRGKGRNQKKRVYIRISSRSWNEGGGKGKKKTRMIHTLTGSRWHVLILWSSARKKEIKKRREFLNPEV